MKCNDCYLRHDCDAQTKFICEFNDYCKYMPEKNFNRKTNANYLRNMTNEEMAEWLVYKVKCTGCNAENCDSEFCVNLMKQWLEDFCE